jgi:NAD(P)-dependent dehydrogenase (short-subunit alcohol dehydrogenase family)
MNIEDRVAVITGAASGIGQAVCQELVNRGIKAIGLVDMSEEVEAAASRLNEKAGRTVAQVFKGDVTNEDFRIEVFDAMVDQHGGVQICVPAAGIVRDALAVTMDKSTGKARLYPAENFRLVTEINYIAPIYWAMEMIGRVAERRYGNGLKRWGPDQGIEGAIVFIGSVASQGNKGQIAYASAKAGLEGAAATLMKEAIFHGVRCSVIHPGFTDTPILRDMGEEYLQKYVLPDTQLGRLIRPEEIADAICFMITNQAVSGALWADAGWHPTAA